MQRRLGRLIRLLVRGLARLLRGRGVERLRRGLEMLLWGVGLVVGKWAYAASVWARSLAGRARLCPTSAGTWGGLRVACAR